MNSSSGTRAFRALSSPFCGDLLGFEAMLCTRLASKYLSRLDKGRLDSDTLATLDRIDQAEPGVDLFRPEFGTVGLGVTRLWRTAPDPDWVLGQFAVAAFVSGAVDEVERSFTATHPLCVAGHLLRSEAFRVSGSNGVLAIRDFEDRLLGEFRLRTSPGVPLWQMDGDSMPIGAGGLSHILWSGGAWAAEWGPEDRRPAVDNPRFPAQVEQAFSLLEAHLPEYYLWTAYLLREVVATARPSPNATGSSSYLMNFGVVELCTPADVLETVEMLVHECSHQHFNLASQWTRFTVEDAPEVYSILKFEARPLDRVLLGFHAFANVLLMFNLLEKRGAPVDPDALTARIRNAVRLVEALYLPLIENKRALNATGLDIYQPLADLLVEEGLLLDERSMIASGRRLEITAD